MTPICIVYILAENGAGFGRWNNPTLGHTLNFLLSFCFKGRFKLRVRREQDWRKDLKSAHESIGTRGRLNRSREGTRPRSEPLVTSKVRSEATANPVTWAI